LRFSMVCIGCFPCSIKTHTGLFEILNPYFSESIFSETIFFIAPKKCLFNTFDGRWIYQRTMSSLKRASLPLRQSRDSVLTGLYDASIFFNKFNIVKNLLKIVNKHYMLSFFLRLSPGDAERVFPVNIGWE
jgi:hypothetical protein